MRVDTLAPLGLSLAKVENQRATKHPRIFGFKVTRHVVDIKKIRECELLCIETMVGIPFTLRPQPTPTSKPFKPRSFSRDLDGNETSFNTIIYFIEHATPHRTFILRYHSLIHVYFYVTYFL